MADIQVVAPVGLRSFGPDLSPLARGIGSFVSDRINERLQEKALGGDNQALTRLASRDPRAASQVGDIFRQEQAGQMREEQSLQKMREQEQAIIPRIAQGFASATDKKGYLFQTSQLLRNQGMERLADDVADDAARFDSDPESVNLEYEAGLAMFTDPEKGRQLTAALAERENLIANLTGAVNPATGEPFTRQEAAQELALREAGIVARAVGSADITTATTPGLTEQVAESESVIKERTKFAELTGSSRANKIDEGYTRIGSINTGLRNIDRALTALDEGAKTGAIQSRFFPSIRAASIKLDQLQNEFALDVISGVTLGAISEAELQLAKEVGLPKNLPEDELRAYLQDKRSAQEKLRGYFEDQISFLEGGGSIADFVAQQKQLREGQDQTATPAQQQGRVIEVDF